MSKIINNINFTDLSIIGKGSSFDNVKTAGITDESELQDYIDAGEEYRNIQSVLIDWNGATTEMGGEEKEINTTGELISYLATA